MFSQQVEDLKGWIAGRESEEERLRKIIAKYKALHPNYIPSRDDVVDAALAEYVNSLDEPLEIQFVREDPGIYTYGSKRVFIKIE